MTDEIVARFGDPDQAHAQFEHFGLDDLSAMLESLKPNYPPYGSTVIRTDMQLKRAFRKDKFSSISELASMSDQKILMEFSQFGVVSLGVLNEALSKLVNEKK